MATKKKAIPAAKKKTTTKTAVKSKKPAVAKAISFEPLPPKKITATYVLYIDSSFFFPGESGDGYADDFQSGRYAIDSNKALQAPIILPVGATIKSVTIYYKNTSTDSMPIAILKKHIDHHCFSGEVEVSLDNCPAGSSIPDNYLEKFINHFDAGGVILDKYLYFIQVFNTGMLDGGLWRTLRGIRLEYVY
jgi:hypothetical protein